MAILNNTVDNVNLVTALGATPAANDTIKITDYATYFTGGLTYTADFTAVVFGKGWTGSITGASTFRFVTNQAGAGKVDVRFGGSVLNLSSTNSTTKHAKVVIAPAAGGTVNYADCLSDEVFVLRGSLVGADTYDPNSVVQVGGSVRLEGGSSPQTTTTYVICGGEVEIKRIVTTLTATGEANVTMDNASGSIGTANLFNDRTTWKAGNCTTKLNLYRGVLDLSEATKEITFADYLLAEGATVILPSSSVMANPFTDSTKYLGNGPKFVTSD